MVAVITGENLGISTGSLTTTGSDGSANLGGSRGLMKKLREEGFEIGRYRVRKLMAKLGLVVQQRVAYKTTTQRKHTDAVAENLLNQNFNPTGPNEVWAGDVTYLRTAKVECIWR